MNQMGDFTEFMRSTQKTLETHNKWMLVVVVILGVVQLSIWYLILMHFGTLAKSAAKYLDTKAVLMMAQLEGKRFVDERVDSAKSGSGDDAKYRPKY